MKRKLRSLLGVMVLLLLVSVLAGCRKEQKIEESIPEEPAEIEDASGQELGDKETPEATPGSGPESESPLPLKLSICYGYDSDWDADTLEQVCSVSWQKLYMEASDAQTYPELAARLEKMGQEREQSAKASMEFLQGCAETMEEVTDTKYTLGSRQEIYVLRADSNCLSFLEFFWEDSGGAHGNYGYNGCTLDPESGEQLKLEEILTDVDKLPDILAEKLKTGYPDTSFFEPPEEALKQYVEEDKFNWVLTQQGIVFLFSPYEVAPYADGALQAAISFQEDTELFMPQYQKTAGRYTVQMELESDLLFDMNDDGSFEKIRVSGTYNEEDGAYEALHIKVGDKEYTEEIYAYDLRPYLMHDTSKKRTWLYVQTRENNDYRTVFAYELSPVGEEAVKKIGELQGWGFHTLQSEAGEIREEVFTNPEQFLMESRTELLSTLAGTKEYCVGEDGFPRTESEYLTVDRGPELTLKVPLTLEIIDGDTGEETFPAGTVFTYYRTDNETVVDLKTEDGRICRLRPEKKDYRLFIDGTEQYEVFDGMIYAG